MFENRQLRSCLWLVHILQKNKRLKFAEINRYWQADLSVSGGNPMPLRTFHNYRNSVQDLFGIVIDCHKPTNTYYINIEQEESLSSWLISSFNVGHLLMDTPEVRRRFLIDAPLSGMVHFNTIVDSFRRNCSLNVVYQKFNGAEPYSCHLQPYCMKLHQQRWYLLAIKNHGDRPVTFALDRMQQVELDQEDFLLPEDFTPQTYYHDSFGVWVGEGDAPIIRLRAFGAERNYLRTLPLHPSQQEVLTADDFSDFILCCHTTKDLLLHLLSHGKGIEVLAPESFRADVANELEAMFSRYKEKS